MKLHPKGWSFEDYSVKTAIESLSFHSESANIKPQVKTEFSQIYLGKKRTRKKKSLTHWVDLIFLCLPSTDWVYMLCLFTQRIHESRWLVGTLKMTLTICFCFPVPKVWSCFFFHFIDFGVYAQLAVMPIYILDTHINLQNCLHEIFTVHILQGLGLPSIRQWLQIRMGDTSNSK